MRRRHSHPISYEAVMKPRPQLGPEVRVSGHAIIRWLERVEGLELDIVRAKILAIAGAAAACGAKILRKGGHTFVMERGAIVTFIPAQRQRLPQRRFPPE